MATTPKKWILIELRGNQVALVVEIDLNLNRDMLGEWVPHYRLLALTDIDTQHHKERGLKTPKTVNGDRVKTLGPTALRPSMLGFDGDDMAIRSSEIVRWAEASDYLAEACDKAWEVDSKAWKSALSGSGIVTANESELARINGAGADVKMPRLPLRLEP